MYPGIYRPMVPPRCPHCVNGRVQRPTRPGWVECDHCNGTGIHGSTRALFAIVAASIVIAYAAILLWALYG
jgi:ribosomal protein L37AE/L43A